MSNVYSASNVYINSQLLTIAYSLKCFGKVYPIGKSNPHDMAPRVADKVSIVACHCLHDNLKCSFWKGFLLVIKSESLTVMLSAVVSGEVEETDLLSNREEKVDCMVGISRKSLLSTVRH